MTGKQYREHHLMIERRQKRNYYKRSVGIIMAYVNAGTPPCVKCCNEQIEYCRDNEIVQGACPGWHAYMSTATTSKAKKRLDEFTGFQVLTKPVWNGRNRLSMTGQAGYTLDTVNKIIGRKYVRVDNITTNPEH